VLSVFEALTADARRNERGERIRRKTPAARWGEPDDLGGAAIFLSSPASDFITGAALPIDGGYVVADQRLPARTPSRRRSPLGAS
jgi:2-dehydro-3-deoxy-D-gluconate 5-dehydrogenase